MVDFQASNAQEKKALQALATQLYVVGGSGVIWTDEVEGDGYLTISLTEENHAIFQRAFQFCSKAQQNLIPEPTLAGVTVDFCGFALS